MLEEIISKCKGAVFLTVNEHKNYYITVEQRLKELKDRGEDLEEDLEEEVYNKILEKDSLIELHFYPRTAIGSYLIYHYDINKALEKALKILTKQNR